MAGGEAGPALVRIPTDVEREERVWGPLTVRQATALALTAGALYVLWWATRTWLPTPAFVPVAAVLLALVLVVVTARRDGQPLDRWIIAALTHQATSRRVRHPIAGQAPAWLTGPAVPAQPGPAARAGVGGEPVRHPRRPPTLPPRTVTTPAGAAVAVGLVDLGPDGYAVLAAADPVDLGLRSPGEQVALIAGWAGLLHSLTAGIQILVRAVPLDVAADADQLTAAADQLPHPALAAAARDHAGFLRTLAAHYELLRRQVIVILHEPRPTPTPVPSGRARRRRHGDRPSGPDMSGPAVQAAQARLARRLRELVDLAGPAGITLHPLGPTEAAAVLATACHPAAGVLAGHLAHPDHVVTGPPTMTGSGAATAAAVVRRGRR